MNTQSHFEISSDGEEDAETKQSRNPMPIYSPGMNVPQKQKQDKVFYFDGKNDDVMLDD